ncbi:MAG: ferrochelatase [Cyclobacteriaceae bacterium]|nr:ferrochelatase [Cyclobacteriaceae bacterium]
MNKGKTGVLLVNLGTPDEPTVGKVRSYLSQFLNDKRVIDLPWLARKLLVNLIIVPFRAKGSSKIYKQVWTDQGSPIIIYGNKIKNLLQDALGDEYGVHLAMRYKNPSLPDALNEMREHNYSKIIVLPLFPQYASATSGSIMEEVMRIMSKWWVIPETRFVGQYYDHPLFLSAWKSITGKYSLNEYDHVLFSFHGLPIRQVDKVYLNGKCEDHNCEEEITPENQYCYKATCYATARLIAGQIGIDKSKYTVCFQSRLDKDWLEPFSDKEVIRLAQEGAKKILVFSPAFIADCLETIVEIGIEYQHLFEEHGGEKVQLVESLNDHPQWIACLADLVKN